MARRGHEDINSSGLQWRYACQQLNSTTFSAVSPATRVNSGWNQTPCCGLGFPPEGNFSAAVDPHVGVTLTIAGRRWQLRSGNVVPEASRWPYPIGPVRGEAFDASGSVGPSRAGRPVGAPRPVGNGANGGLTKQRTRDRRRHNSCRLARVQPDWARRRHSTASSVARAAPPGLHHPTRS